MRGICLVSLGAKHLTPEAIARVALAGGTAGVKPYFWILDSLEAVNQRVLHKLGPSEAQDRVNELLLKLVRKVPAHLWGQRGMRKLSELSSEPNFQRIVEKVTSVYANNRSFAHECQAQIFKNLHPRLKRIGVKNMRHPSIADLADYIVMEIALKLYLVETESYDVEYAWSRDMAVWQSVISGKYPEFPALSKVPKFVTVDVPDPEPYCLRLQNVSFSYERANGDDQSTKKHGALRNLSFSAKGVAAILGPSGSFKTTLLKIVAAHLTPSSGTIHIGDMEVTNRPTEQRRVATVFQNFALFPHLTALENVMEGARLRIEYTAEDRVWLADMYLRRLNVSHCRDRLPSATSGGEQQRIAIARALAAEPLILAMDEPTAAIDGLQRESLAGIIGEITDTFPALTILIVSHDRDFVLSVAEQLIVMDGGEIIAQGKRTDVLSAPPNRRTAEILQTHTAIEGTLGSDGVFSPGAGRARAWRVSNPPAQLQGSRCIALVPHHGVSFRALGGDDAMSPAKERGVIVSLVDYGSTLKMEAEVQGGFRVTSVATKTSAVSDFEVGASIDVYLNPEQVVLVAQ